METEREREREASILSDSKGEAVVKWTEQRAKKTCQYINISSWSHKCAIFSAIHVSVAAYDSFFASLLLFRLRLTWLIGPLILIEIISTTKNRHKNFQIWFLSLNHKKKFYYLAPIRLFVKSFFDIFHVITISWKSLRYDKKKTAKQFTNINCVNVEN